MIVLCASAKNFTFSKISKFQYLIVVCTYLKKKMTEQKRTKKYMRCTQRNKSKSTFIMNILIENFRKKVSGK